jgi:hypothetical protein
MARPPRVHRIWCHSNIYTYYLPPDSGRGDAADWHLAVAWGNEWTPAASGARTTPLTLFASVQRRPLAVSAPLR